MSTYDNRDAADLRFRQQLDSGRGGLSVSEPKDELMDKRRRPMSYENAQDALATDGNEQAWFNPYARTTRIVSVLNETGRNIQLRNPEDSSTDVLIAPGLHQVPWGRSISIPHYHTKAIHFEGYGYLFRHYWDMHYTLGRPPARDNDGTNIFTHHYHLEGVFVTIGLFPDKIRVLHSVNQLHAIVETLGRALGSIAHIPLQTVKAFVGNPGLTREAATILDARRGEVDGGDLQKLGKATAAHWQKAFDELTPKEKEQLVSGGPNAAEIATKVLRAIAIHIGVTFGSTVGAATIVTAMFAVIPGTQALGAAFAVIAGLFAIAGALSVGLLEVVVWILSFFG